MTGSPGNKETEMLLIPCGALLALLTAWLLFRWMKAQDEGNDTMKDIATAVRRVPSLICAAKVAGGFGFWHCRLALIGPRRH